MDHDRLKDVRRTEQTESRINEDFVEWLKSTGLTLLVGVMVILVAYMLYVRWSDGRTQHQNNAWIELASSETSGLPSGLLDVAERYGEVGSVSLLARIKAGRAWLDAVQAGRPLDASPESTTPLAPEDRDMYLSRADQAFSDVLVKDDRSDALSLLMISAYNGRAAVAEARGEIEEAQRLYREAAARAGDTYPHLKQQAEKRADTVAAIVNAPALPAEDELPAGDAEDESPVTPVDIDPALRDLLLSGER